MKILVLLFLGYALAGTPLELDTSSEETDKATEETEETSEEYEYDEYDEENLEYGPEDLPFITCNEDKDCESKCKATKDVEWTPKDCANMTFCDKRPKQGKNHSEGEDTGEEDMETHTDHMCVPFPCCCTDTADCTEDAAGPAKPKSGFCPPKKEKHGRKIRDRRSSEPILIDGWIDREGELPDWVPKMEKGEGVCNDRKICEEPNQDGYDGCMTSMASDYIKKDGSGSWSRAASTKCILPANRCHWDGTIREFNSIDMPIFTSTTKDKKLKTI